MWPWEAFNWGMFWAVLAVVGIYYLTSAAIGIVVALFQHWIES